MSEELTEGIPLLLYRLQREGISTNELRNWRAMNIAAMLLATESGAQYLIEPVEGEPSLITRLAEVPPYYDRYRMPHSTTIVRRQGTLDGDLLVDSRVDIYGLSRKGVEFDPDSSYCTTPLVEIKYLAS